MGAQAQDDSRCISACTNRATAERKLNVEVLDLPSLTPQAVLVTLYDALLQTNDSTAETSYHLTGSIDLDGYPPSPLDLWASAGDAMARLCRPPLLTGEHFARLYSNGARQGAVRAIDLDVEAIPRRLQVEWSARGWFQTASSMPATR